MSKFPVKDIGTVNGIEVVYDVHWLDWDKAQLTVDDAEILTFSSAQTNGFTSEEGVLTEAADVVYQIEEEEWD